MLSVSNITAASAETYYTKDDYYLEEKSEWYGKGRADLFNSDKIKVENWVSVVNGFAEKKGQMYKLNAAAGTTKHRPGTDLTFSAPKSVSLLAMTDQNVIDAHDRSVNKILDYIENNLTFTRTNRDGVSHLEQVDNLLIGKHLHLTSRELEPQLHTHAVVINSVVDEKKNRKSLFNDLILKNTKNLGQMYRNELANEIKKCGYEIEITDRNHGFFEIRGIDAEMIDTFSTRRKQVLAEEKLLKDQNINLGSTQLNQRATLSSRQSKKRIDKTSLIEKTNSLLKTEFNTDLTALKNQTNLFQQNDLSKPLTDYYEASLDAIHENSSVFTSEDLISQISKISLGSYTLNDINDKIDQDIESRDVIHLMKSGKKYLTTAEMFKTENGILETIRNSRTKSILTIDTDKIETDLNQFEMDNFKLTKGQIEMVRKVSGSTDQFIKIQGDAGTGKTTSLKLITDSFDQSSIPVVLLAPTAKAADELKLATNKDSQTVKSFLLSNEFKDNSLIVVDESSMLGVKDAKELVDISKKTNSKLVFLGDVKQFQSISAGRFFDDMDKTGTTIVNMTESNRQKTNALKSIVTNIKDKKINIAFDKLIENDMVVEKSNLDELKQSAVDKYFEIQNQNKSSILIVSKNSDRVELNDLIRHRLIDEGKIESIQNYNILKSANISAKEKQLSNSYHNDQVIIFNKQANISDTVIKAGEKFAIQNVDTGNNLISISKIGVKDNQVIEIDPVKHSKTFQIFNQESIAIGKGDSLQFTKNDKLYNSNNVLVKIENGLSGQVKSADENQLIVETKKGDLYININLNDKGSYSFFDYNYALTNYKSQGSTVDHLIAFSPTNDNVHSLNSFYVAATRAKYDLTILTDDVKNLSKKVTKNQHKLTTTDFDYSFSELDDMSVINQLVDEISQDSNSIGFQNSSIEYFEDYLVNDIDQVIIEVVPDRNLENEIQR